jgi:hypothetical protein
MPKFLRISTKIFRIMLDDGRDDVENVKSVDENKFYDVLNSTFASSSAEHLMDRVAKMTTPGQLY